MPVNAKHMVSWPAHCVPLTITGQLLQLHQHNGVSSDYKLDQSVHRFSEQCPALAECRSRTKNDCCYHAAQSTELCSVTMWLPHS